MIFVFLNNKLISCDTITPLLLELSEKHPNARIVLYCFGDRTLGIIRRNVVLWNALQQVGQLRSFAGRSKIKAVRRAVGLLTLALIAVRALLGDVTFIHFKALNWWPLKLLFLVNRKRTFLFQSSSIGVSEAEKRIGQITALRIPSRVLPAAGTMVGFSETWPAFHDGRTANVPKLVVTPPFRRPAWRAYLLANADRYLGPLGLGQRSPFAVFILSSMDRFNLLVDPDAFPVLFEETLEILAQEAPDLPIIVKPHPATLPNILDLQRKIIERSPKKHVIVADLHPLLLAARARFFIGNTFSSTFASAHLCGVPTIEYTHYSADGLEASGGGSMRADLVTNFINRNPDELRRRIRKVLAAPADARAWSDGTDDDSSYEDLLEMLASGPRHATSGQPSPLPG